LTTVSPVFTGQFDRLQKALDSQHAVFVWATDDGVPLMVVYYPY
jgi:hypothetical protein